MALKLPHQLVNAEWTGYKCYVTYLALKAHFTRDNYDFHRYGGKTNASVTSFETRKDRYQFEKLSRFPDPVGLMVAHLSKDTKTWIGSINPKSDVYTQFEKRLASLPYTVRTECGSLKETLDDNLWVPQGTHPYLLTAFLGGVVSLETMCVMQSVFNFIPYWDEEILDPVVWPENRRLIMKMSPFLEFDRVKMKEVIGDKIDL